MILGIGAVDQVNFWKWKEEEFSGRKEWEHSNLERSCVSVVMKTIGMCEFSGIGISLEYLAIIILTW